MSELLDQEWGNGLDDGQRGVAGADPSARLVVTAGPGTGKTRTLLARARYLIEVKDIGRSENLAIFSFSRAAVETVARRSHEEMEISRLPIRTIDSFASILLSRAEVNVGQKSFDSRIVRATELLREDVAADRYLGDLRHILIDEAQDIVGVRATFVQELLTFVSSSIDNGYTIFGDSAQAIFDFQEGPGFEAAGPGRFLTTMANKSDSAELLNNYRMEPKVLAPLARRYGKALRSQDSDPMKLWDGLKTAIAADTGWEDLDEAADAVKFATKADWCSSLAVLCRTNADVLEIGAILRSAGLDVLVNHRAVDRGGAPWLATMFGDARFGKARLPDAQEEFEGQSWLHPPGDLPTVLRHAGVMRNKEVDLKRLATLLRIRACPESLITRRKATVVVSTIHRAKGQEFDTVFAVQDRRPGPKDNAAEEARVLYVAATRPRIALAACPPIERPGPLHFTKENRVMVCSWQKRMRPRRVEVRVSDSDPDWNASTCESFVSNQDRLRSELVPGDPIELRLNGECGREFPVYDAFHIGADGSRAIVGRTGEAFGEFMQGYVLGRKPDLVTGLTAEVPDTASMMEASAKEVGLGEHGLHLRARFYGLGHLQWEDPDG